MATTLQTVSTMSHADAIHTLNIDAPHLVNEYLVQEGLV
jgi:hypothetical protein